MFFIQCFHNAYYYVQFIIPTQPTQSPSRPILDIVGRAAWTFGPAQPALSKILQQPSAAKFAKLEGRCEGEGCGRLRHWCLFNEYPFKVV